MENKSKFGIAAALMGAFMYLAVGINLTVYVLLLIAVMVWEDNAFVKLCAKRAGVLYIVYRVVYYVLDAIIDFLGKFKFYHGTKFGIVIGNVFNTTMSWLSLAFEILVLVLAIMAICKPVCAKNFVDSINDKFDGVKAAPAAGKTCPKCGKPVPAGSAFCTSCGAKMEEAAAENTEA